MSGDKVKCKGRVPIAIINILEMNDPGIEMSKDGITGPCECEEGKCIGKGCECDACKKKNSVDALHSLDPETWLKTIWDALWVWQEMNSDTKDEDGNLASGPQEQWDDICLAMAWIRENLSLPDETIPFKYNSEQEIACVFCKEKYRIKYSSSDWLDWRGGKMIQNAFPYLSVRDRELIKTQDCGCWIGRSKE